MFAWDVCFDWCVLLFVCFLLILVWNILVNFCRWGWFVFYGCVLLVLSFWWWLSLWRYVDCGWLIVELFICICLMIDLIVDGCLIFVYLYLIEMCFGVFVGFVFWFLICLLVVLTLGFRLLVLWVFASLLCSDCCLVYLVGWLAGFLFACRLFYCLLGLIMPRVGFKLFVLVILFVVVCVYFGCWFCFSVIGGWRFCLFCTIGLVLFDWFLGCVPVLGFLWMTNFVV